jgi:hypothetical protein
MEKQIDLLDRLQNKINAAQVDGVNNEIILSIAELKEIIEELKYLEREVKRRETFDDCYYNPDM